MMGWKEGIETLHYLGTEVKNGLIEPVETYENKAKKQHFNLWS